MTAADVQKLLTRPPVQPLRLAMSSGKAEVKQPEMASCCLTTCSWDGRWPTTACPPSSTSARCSTWQRSNR